MKKYPLNFVEIISVLALLAFIISPLMLSGYYGDDSLNSMINAVMQETGRSLLDQTVYNFKAYADSRLLWLQLFHWTFMLLKKLWLVKIYSLTLVLLSAFVFSKLVCSISNSKKIVYLSLFLPALFIQYRNYGDPVLVFHGVAMINAISLFASLLLLQHYLKTSQRKFLYWSIFSYFLCINTYEIAYPLFVMHFLLFYFDKHKQSLWKTVRATLPFAMLPVVFALINFGLRMAYAGKNIGADPTFHTAYVPNFQLTSWLISLAKQIYATFPLSYYFTDPHLLFGKNAPVPSSLVAPQLGFVAVAILVLFCYVFSHRSQLEPSLELPESENKNAPLVLFSLGLCLMLLPCGLLALSPKYQSEIVWGVGYTPIFLGYFGVIFVLMAIGSLPLKKIISSVFLKRSLIAGVAIVAAYIGAMNFWNNQITVEVANTFWHYPRTVAEDAMKNGLMKDLPQDSYLLIDSNFPWDITSFIRANTGIRLSQDQYSGGKNRFLFNRAQASILVGQKNLDAATYVPTLNPLLKQGLKENYFDNFLFHFKDGDKVFYFDYYSDARDNGYAILAPITDLILSNDVISAAASCKVSIFVRTPRATGGWRNLTIFGRMLKANDLSQGQNFSVSENALKLTAAGTGWRILELSCAKPSQAIDIRSIAVSSISKFVQPSTFWKPTQANKFLLKKQADSVLHFGSESEFNGSGASLSPLKFPKEFTLEMIVRPSGLPQAQHSHIIGNHPGINNFEGFAIQWINSGNDYNFAFGDGKQWNSGGVFSLTPEQVNYLAIISDGTSVRIFNNGKFSSTVTNAKLVNSALPLSLGNYLNGDRPFLGFINELQITAAKVSESDILANWKKAATLSY